MIEPFRHDRNDRGNAAADLIGHGKREHEVLAACRCMVGRGEDRAEIVAGVTQAARRHVAVEQIDIAHEARVIQRGLIRRRRATANQGARTRAAVLVELLAKRLERLARQRADRTAQAVEDVSLEHGSRLRREMLRTRVESKLSDTFSRSRCTHVTKVSR